MTVIPDSDFYTTIPGDVLAKAFLTPLKYASKKVKIINDLADQVTTVSTDGLLAADSDTIIPTQKAVKDYVDNHSGAVNTYSQPLVDTAGVVAIRDEATNVMTAVKQTVTNTSTALPSSAGVYNFVNDLLPLAVTTKRIPYGNALGTGYTSGGLIYDNTSTALTGFLSISGGASVATIETREDTNMTTIQASTGSLRLINGPGLTATFDSNHNMSLVGTMTASNYTTDQAAAVTNATLPSALNPFVTVSGLASASFMPYKLQTGIITGGQLSINADPQKFDVAAGSGYFIDTTTVPGSATMTLRTWAGFSAVVATYRLTNARTWVYLDMLGANPTVGQQVTYPTTADRRNRAYIGCIWHHTNANLLVFQYLPSYSWEDLVATDMLWQDDIPKKLNVKDFLITPNGANMLININSGTAIRKGLNGSADPRAPNSLFVSGSANLATAKLYRNGTGGLKGFNASTGIFPSQYDPGTGSLQLIPAGNWSIQLAVGYYSSSGSIVATYYGQFTYATMDAARIALATQPYTLTQDGAGGLIIGAHIIRQDCTSLQDTTKYMFVPVEQFAAQAIISDISSRIGENDVMVTASASPGGATLQTFLTNYKTWRFATAGDDLYFSGEFDHGWQVGTSWVPHIHISTETTAVAPNDQYQWTIDFTYWYGNALNWTSSSNNVTGTYNLAAPLVHNINFPALIPSTSVANPILFHIHITRNAPANAYTGNVFLHGCGIHYTSDRWGKP